MTNYLVKENRDSRVFRYRYGRAIETREYIVSILKDAPAEVNIRPTMASAFRYPNVGGTPDFFTAEPNMKHPDAYYGFVTTEGTQKALFMRLELLEAEWVPNNTRAIRVKMTFRNIPNQAYTQWSVDSSVTSEQTQTDINLNLIRGPNGQTITVGRMKPQLVERATRNFLRMEEGMEEAVEYAIGKLNEESWRRHGPGRWMCTGATVDPVDDGHCDVSYSFQYDPNKWETFVRPLGEDGDPDPEAEPIAIPLYERVDFHVLHGLRARADTGRRH